MNRTVRTLAAKLAQGRSMSLGLFAAKASQFLRESAAGLAFLRACDRVGARARVDGTPRIRNLGFIALGDDVRLTSRWAPIELSTTKDGAIRIGNGSSVNYGTLISASKSVRIGQRAMIGNYCVISDTAVPGTPPSAADTPRPVEIGDDVWLAVRVTVMPGSKIGAGAVISAGSVVDGEIPPGVLAGGIPARVLRGAVQAAPAEIAS